MLVDFLGDDGGYDDGGQCKALRSALIYSEYLDNNKMPWCGHCHKISIF